MRFYFIVISLGLSLYSCRNSSNHKVFLRAHPENVNRNLKLEVNEMSYTVDPIDLQMHSTAGYITTFEQGANVNNEISISCGDKMVYSKALTDSVGENTFIVIAFLPNTQMCDLKIDQNEQDSTWQTAVLYDEPFFY